MAMAYEYGKLSKSNPIRKFNFMLKDYDDALKLRKLKKKKRKVVSI